MFIILFVDVGPKADKGLDVVLFYAHDCVMKRGGSICINNIWIESFPYVFQEVNGYYAFSLLCSTMKHRQLIAGPDRKISVELFVENL